MKILSTHDLQAIMQRAENALRLREQSNKKIAEKSCGLTIGTDHLQILVCGGTGCTASSGHLIAEHLQKALEQYNIVHQVEVITTGLPPKMLTKLSRNTLSMVTEWNDFSISTRKPNVL